MSYDISFKNSKGDCFELDKVMEEGGTFTIGDRSTCLNVTYNYSWYYYMFLDKKKGIGWLYGKKGVECIDKLEEAIRPFKDYLQYEKDYWADTPGNCIKPLKIFLGWCKKFPEGVFDGT